MSYLIEAHKLKIAALEVVAGIRDFRKCMNGLCDLLSAYDSIPEFFHDGFDGDRHLCYSPDHGRSFGRAGDFNDHRLTAIALLATMPVEDIAYFLNPYNQ